MSWHFSQAQVADYLRAASLAGGLSAPLRSTGTDGTWFAPGRTMDALIHSQYGTISAPSAESSGGAVLTWYLAGFHAKPTPRQLEAKALRMISGRKCDGSWQMSLPGTFLPRTSPGERLTQPATTSRRWVTKPAQLPFQRQTWVLTTFGKDTGFVHTPTGAANYSAPSMQKHPNCREFVKVFGRPTPEIHEWLMDWPIGWTELSPLETDKWQSWLRLHGGF